MNHKSTPQMHRFFINPCFIAVLFALAAWPGDLHAQACDTEADFTVTTAGCNADFAPLYSGPGKAVHEWKFYNGSAPTGPFSSSDISQPIFTFSALPGGGYVTHTIIITLPDGEVLTRTCAKPVATSCALAGMCHPAYYYYYQVSGCALSITQGFGSLAPAWSFGDATAPVTAVLPSHTYTAPGNYVVSLDYHGKPCSLVVKVGCEEEVIVEPPVALFQYYLEDAADPLRVTFSDMSDPLPTARHWDFGDGTTSQDAHPTHAYTLPGNYEVCLIASNGSAADTVCQPIVVNTSGIRDLPNWPPARVLPNPFSADLRVQLPALEGVAPRFVLFDLYGRQLANVSLTELETVLPLPALPAGVYGWQVFRQGVLTQQGKVVKGF